MGLTTSERYGLPDVCFESLISDKYCLPLQLQTKSECNLRLDEEVLLQDATWYGSRPRRRRHFDRWEPCCNLPKKGAEPPPQSSAHVCCGQTAGWIKVALRVEVGVGPGHIVLDGDPAPLPKKGCRAPQFSAHLYCSETARCTKMPLGMEEGLSAGDFVLDRDPASSLKRGIAPQIFCPCLVGKRLDGSRCHLVQR